jgi:hypothetical protein
MRSLEEITADIDAVCAHGERRMKESKDPSIRGLRPCAADWMTDDERQQLTLLKAEWVKAQPTTEELKRRVAEKRAARRKAQKS